MPIVIARIDDRLIHGQVTVGWTRPNNINRIIVVNDALAKDQVQSMMLKIAAPPGVTVDAQGVQQCIQNLQSGSLDKFRLMLVFTGPLEPLALLRAGIQIKTLNVGGMRFTPGRRKISTSVSVSPEEEQAFRDIGAAGVEVEVRMFPADPKVNLLTLLNG